MPSIPAIPSHQCYCILDFLYILFVPSLFFNLFLPNCFARDCHATYLEVTDYQVRKWLNRQASSRNFITRVGVRAVSGRRTERICLVWAYSHACSPITVISDGRKATEIELERKGKARE